MNPSRLFEYSILETTVRLRVDSPALHSLAEKLHSCCRCRNEACDTNTPADLIWKQHSKNSNTLEISGVVQPVALSDAALFMTTEHTVTGLFGTKLVDHVQFHAASVVDPQGNGWMIPGPSGTGKSSLTLALMLQGWFWLSDELTLLGEQDPELMLAFPRNFNVKQVSFPVFPETADKPHSIEFYSEGRKTRVRFFDPLEVVPGSLRPSARIKGLLLARWTPDPSANHIRLMPGIAAAQWMLGEGVKLHPWAFASLTRLCRDLPVVEFSYSNARETTQLIDTLQRVVS